MKLAELSIFTDSVAETTAFYRQLLGVAPAHEMEGFALFEGEGFHVVVHRKLKPEEGDLPAESHVGFRTPDLDGAVNQMKDAGFTVVYLPKDWPWGRSAYLRDPAGGLIELSAG